MPLLWAAHTVRERECSILNLHDNASPATAGQGAGECIPRRVNSLGSGGAGGL